MNPNSHLESHYSCVHSEKECTELIEEARKGNVGRVRRRLNETEKSRIRPGSIFIYKEEESGIRRWTDKREWTPSRVQGIFLIYRELNGMLVKKTYACNMEDGRYHVVAYTLLDWEIDGRCCVYYKQRQDLNLLNTTVESWDLISSAPEGSKMFFGRIKAANSANDFKSYSNPLSYANEPLGMMDLSGSYEYFDRQHQFRDFNENRKSSKANKISGMNNMHAQFNKSSEILLPDFSSSNGRLIGQNVNVADSSCGIIYAGSQMQQDDQRMSNSQIFGTPSASQNEKYNSMMASNSSDLNSSDSCYTYNRSISPQSNEYNTSVFPRSISPQNGNLRLQMSEMSFCGGSNYKNKMNQSFVPFAFITNQRECNFDPETCIYSQEISNELQKKFSSQSEITENSVKNNNSPITQIYSENFSDILDKNDQKSNK